MGIKIGDVDVSNEIIELHFQIARTQLFLDQILNKSPSLSASIALDDIREIDKKALEIVQKKFPNMDIKKKNTSS